MPPMLLVHVADDEAASSAVHNVGICSRCMVQEDEIPMS